MSTILPTLKKIQSSSNVAQYFCKIHLLQSVQKFPLRFGENKLMIDEAWWWNFRNHLVMSSTFYKNIKRTSANFRRINEISARPLCRDDGTRHASRRNRRPAKRSFKPSKKDLGKMQEKINISGNATIIYNNYDILRKMYFGKHNIIQRTTYQHI